MALTTHLSCRVDTTQDVFVVVVSKRVARLAVQRNQLKRRIREIIRTHHKSFRGFLYTKKGASELSFSELQAEVEQLLVVCK